MGKKNIFVNISIIFSLIISMIVNPTIKTKATPDDTIQLGRDISGLMSVNYINLITEYYLYNVDTEKYLVKKNMITGAIEGVVTDADYSVTDEFIFSASLAIPSDLSSIFSNDSETLYQNGDYFIINYPTSFVFTGDVIDVELKTDGLNGEVVFGIARFSAENITIILNENCNNYVDIVAQVQAGIAIDIEKYNNRETKNFVFDVFGSTVAFEVTKPNVNSISKAYVSYDDATREITWTITVNYNGAESVNAVVTDLFESSIRNAVELSKDANGKYPSLNLNSNEEIPYKGYVSNDYNGKYYTYDESTRELKIYLGDITNKQVITFKTTVQKEKMIEWLEGTGTTYSIKNEAKLKSDGRSEINSWATAVLNVTMINKASRTTSYNYNATDKEIVWQITVNQAKLDVNDAVVVDTIPIQLVTDVKNPIVTYSEGIYGYVTDADRVQTSDGSSNGTAIKACSANKDNTPCYDTNNIVEVKDVNGNTTHLQLSFYLGNIEGIKTIYFKTALGSNAFNDSDFSLKKYYTNKAILKGSMYDVDFKSKENG